MENDNVKTQNENHEDWQTKAGEYLNNWKRAQADFINYKKDQDKKNLDFWVYKSAALGAMDAIRDLYTAMYSNQSKLGSFKEFLYEFNGIRKLQSAIDQSWSTSGIRKIPVEGQKFDPDIHEPIPGSDKEGEKLEEVAPGYAIGDNVIRPARVKLVATKIK